MMRTFAEGTATIGSKQGLKLLMMPLGTADTPSSRLRVYESLPYLVQEGIRPVVFGPRVGPLIPGIPVAFYKLRLMAHLLASDVVFIQKLLLPPGTVRLMKMLNRRILFNSDDAMYTKGLGREDISETVLAQRRARFEFMIMHSARVLVPNEHLAQYAREFNPQVGIWPVPVDCNKLQPLPAKSRRDKLIIGWAGTGDQWFEYLKILTTPLASLAREYPIKFKMIGVRGAKRIHRHFSGDVGFEVEMVEWLNSHEDVATAITDFDIGVVPMAQDEYSRGRFPAKALEYMAAGVPMVVTPVGVDLNVLQDGYNAMFATTEDEWFAKLKTLAQNAELRRSMGEAARATVEKHYSLETINAKLAKELRELARQPRLGFVR